MVTHLGFMVDTLAVVVDGKWKPGIGDPSIFGWITVAAYLIAFVLCLRTGFADRKLLKTGRKDIAPLFWFALAGVLLLLGINKQLDLQTLLTEQIRLIARQRGWLAYKQQLEQWFIMTLTLVGIVLLTSMVWSTRRALKRVWLAIVGATFLVVFILVRASSFHHVDQWLGLPLGAANRNVALELGGICIVAIAAFLCRPGNKANKDISAPSMGSTE